MMPNHAFGWMVQAILMRSTREATNQGEERRQGLCSHAAGGWRTSKASTGPDRLRFDAARRAKKTTTAKQSDKGRGRRGRKKERNPENKDALSEPCSWSQPDFPASNRTRPSGAEALPSAAATPVRRCTHLISPVSATSTWVSLPPTMDLVEKLDADDIRRPRRV
ncbi:hypothetical protein LY76DRAFT_213929 [Colletotrichum caudatum]|nr:hypothetical protein LY76DRAFT_213929 [Colletotrichum caudatum]